MRAPLLLLVTVCLAVVPGCQESGFDEARETARPLKVQHAFGESKVPGQAEAPAALSLEALDDTLALNVEPVAAYIPTGKLPAYLRPLAGAVTLIEKNALPPAETDVIIASVPQIKARFAALTKVAPTVVIDKGGAQWKLNLRLVGEALGRTNDAEALLSTYDRQLARARNALPQDAKVTGSYADDSFAASLLADAGVELVERGGARLRSSAWAGSGGALAARAALADLQRTLGS